MRGRKHYGNGHTDQRVKRACGKTRYRTRGIAEDARHRRLDEELRIYGCPECGGFHLTSRKTGAIR